MESYKSPYYSRMYGGYTKKQTEHIRTLISSSEGLEILDPMAGQAYALTELTASHRLTLHDINPAALFFARLHGIDPVVEALNIKKAIKILTMLKEKEISHSWPIFSNGWISDYTKERIGELFQFLSTEARDNPFNSGQFWEITSCSTFLLAALLLSAREITCYRRSKNAAWLRAGGAQHNNNVFSAMLNALELWQGRTLEKYLARKFDITCKPINLLNIEKNDSLYDFIITSPPYANRLDYSNLWGPELALLGFAYAEDIDNIRLTQIGSPAVSGRSRIEIPDELISPSVLSTLRDIRDDGAYWSEGYYYPYFRNYIEEMALGFSGLVRSLKPNGKMAIYFRDTIRKDKLLNVKELILHACARGACVKSVYVDRELVTNHIGAVRSKRSAKMEHGTAQREWCIVLERV